MAYLVSDNQKITTKRIREMKQTGEKIAVLTSYDYTIASLVEQGGTTFRGADVYFSSPESFVHVSKGAEMESSDLAAGKGVAL